MNYKIKYKLYKNDKLIKQQTILVKNTTNEYYAKGKLEMHLHKHHDFDTIKFVNVEESDTFDDDMFEQSPFLQIGRGGQ